MAAAAHTHTHTHTQDALACEYRWSHANSGCRIKNTGNAFAVRTNDDEWRAILSRRHVPLAKNHSFILGSWFGFNGGWRGERGHRFASLAVLSSCFSNFWEFITNYARSAELYVRIIHTFKLKILVLILAQDFCTNLKSIYLKKKRVYFERNYYNNFLKWY